jgi:hypothetical protein
VHYGHVATLPTSVTHPAMSAESALSTANTRDARPDGEAGCLVQLFAPKRLGRLRRSQIEEHFERFGMIERKIAHADVKQGRKARGTGLDCSKILFRDASGALTAVTRAPHIIGGQSIGVAFCDERSIEVRTAADEINTTGHADAVLGKESPGSEFAVPPPPARASAAKEDSSTGQVRVAVCIAATVHAHRGTLLQQLSPVFPSPSSLVTRPRTESPKLPPHTCSYRYRTIATVTCVSTATLFAAG